MKNFFRKETPADKMRAEIESMEFKKNSIVTVIKSEKSAIEKQKTQLLYNMGLYAYNQSQAEVKEYDFTETVTEIKKLDEQIALKNQKSLEMGSRYDEEILLLQANLDMMNPVITPVSPVSTASTISVDQEKVFCENCGKQMLKTDSFCQSCGTKTSV